MEHFVDEFRLISYGFIKAFSLIGKNEYIAVIIKLHNCFEKCWDFREVDLSWLDFESKHEPISPVARGNVHSKETGKWYEPK